MGGFGSGPQAKSKGRKRATKLHTPKKLVEGARPYFRSLAGRAADHGLTQADVPILAQLATALWLADTAAAQMEAGGILITDIAHARELRKHPAYTIWRNAAALAASLAQQFGLTPASRARLGLEEDDGTESLADVLFGEVAHHERSAG